MPSDLTIRPLSSLPPAQPSPLQNTKLPPAEVPPVGAALAAMVPQIPSIALNAEKGLVVIDFRNDAGTIVNSIPSAQQLAAYAASQPPLPVAPTPAASGATISGPRSSPSAPHSSAPPPQR